MHVRTTLAGRKIEHDEVARARGYMRRYPAGAWPVLQDALAPKRKVAEIRILVSAQIPCPRHDIAVGELQGLQEFAVGLRYRPIAPGQRELKLWLQLARVTRL